jgi:hypothetical protein
MIPACLFFLFNQLKNGETDKVWWEQKVWLNPLHNFCLRHFYADKYLARYAQDACRNAQLSLPGKRPLLLSDLNQNSKWMANSMKICSVAVNLSHADIHSTEDDNCILTNFHLKTSQNYFRLYKMLQYQPLRNCCKNKRQDFLSY